MSYKLPKLNYPFDALEPHIDAMTMEIHYNKHHQAYVTKLNDALASANYKAPGNINELIAYLSKVPDSIRGAVRNNGGGHANHSFFWNIISPTGGGTPQGELKTAIEEEFGSFGAFQEKFKNNSSTRFGSGWGWLCAKPDGKLTICSTLNQDSPLMKGVSECEGTPIIGLDVWEHAYYLKYQNRRLDYVDAFWNIVDWNQANENYKAATS